MNTLRRPVARLVLWMVAAFFSLLHTGAEEARAGRLPGDLVESTIETSILALMGADPGKSVGSSERSSGPTTIKST